MTNVLQNKAHTSRAGKLRQSFPWSTKETIDYSYHSSLSNLVLCAYISYTTNTILFCLMFSNTAKLSVSIFELGSNVSSVMPCVSLSFKKKNHRTKSGYLNEAYM